MKLLQNRVLSATLKESNTWYISVSQFPFSTSAGVDTCPLVPFMQNKTEWFIGSLGTLIQGTGRVTNCISFLLLLQSITTNLSVQNNAKLLSYSSESPKTIVLQFFLEALGEISFLPPSSFQKTATFLSHSPFLHLQTSHCPLLPLSHHPCIWPSGILSVSTSAPPGESRITSPSHPIARSFIYATPAKSLWPCSGDLFTGSGDQDRNVLGDDYSVHCNSPSGPKIFTSIPHIKYIQTIPCSPTVSTDNSINSSPKCHLIIICSEVTNLII